MADPRELFEKLVYQTDDRRRYTQQSPVMPDVWIQYGLNPGERLDLLMVPNWHYTPADLASDLRERLSEDDEFSVVVEKFRDRGDAEGDGARGASVAHNQSVVVARLWFDQLVRCVLPLSSWWRDSVSQVGGSRKGPAARRRGQGKDLLAELVGKGRGQFVKFVTELIEGGSKNAAVTRDVAWLTRVAGLVAYLSREDQRELAGSIDYEDDWARHVEDVVDARKNRVEHVRALFEILDGISSVLGDDRYPLYSVNRNRQTAMSLYESISAVKADAVQRVFEVRGKGVRWAVVDSGIDAEHIAFRKRDEEGKAEPAPFLKPQAPRRRRRAADPRRLNRTRIVATYEFTHIRELLGAEPDEVDHLNRKRFPVLTTKAKREALRIFLQDLKELKDQNGSNKLVIDWARLEQFIAVPHQPGAKGYRKPSNPHGTHVAGVLAADWRNEDKPPPPGGPRLTGICPEIELYDLRVLDDEGRGNEFAIMSALQFIRELNNRKDFVAVHGANLSFSIDHDVANYACGRTPVCDEAERLVNSGIVVATAAGNSGRARYVTPSNEIDDGFRTVSITDPGNADGVITVGATHRTDAHTYGVSYFSSRGPTGDGRLKPDLVAPGEKIRSTVPDDEDDTLDGTSMAAPHVSGAAALLIARKPEFIGQPRRIKEILCKTATDLDRERYFQGAGLLDILRALQSV